MASGKHIRWQFIAVALVVRETLESNVDDSDFDVRPGVWPIGVPRLGTMPPADIR